LRIVYRTTLLLLTLLGPACDLWPRDNPLDPARCDPRCTGDEVCREGKCVALDAGPDAARPDAPPTDSGVDRGLDLTPDGGAGSCPKPGWTVMTSGVTVGLHGVWGSAGDDVLAVGDQGTILRFDGKSWTKMTSPTTADLLAVFGTAGTRVFAVGESGTVLQYDGNAWSSLGPVSGGEDLRGVWADSSGVWVVGDGGAIYRHDGTGWTSLKKDSTGWRAIWGRSSKELFVAGGTQVDHYDGSSWSTVLGPGFDAVNAIWGNSVGLVAVGTIVGGTGSPPGTAWQENLGTWTPSTSVGGSPLNAVWGSTDDGADLLPGDLFAVGQSGSVRYYDGWSWHDHTQAAGSVKNLEGVWRSDDNQLFVVGELGTILHHRGSWLRFPKQTSNTLAAVWGTGPADLVIVGEKGVVLRYTGGAWSSELAGDKPHEDVWVNGAGEIYTLYSPGAYPAGVVKKWDGSAWSDLRTIPSFVSGIWGADTGELVVAGYKHIEQFDGAAWNSLDSLSTIYLDVWGASAADIYAVGKSGDISHWDGQGWTHETTVPVTDDLHGVWGAAGEIFVSGDKGAVLRGKAGSWTQLLTDMSARFDRVWASSATDLFLVGSSGLAVHYDGKSFRSTVTGTSHPLGDVWGSGPDDVYAVGGGGTVLRWCGP
jgi:hypothetical protein